MPRAALSAAFVGTLAEVSAPESARLLLEIDHPSLTAPVRVINDTQDLTSNGETYTAAAFEVTLPEDIADQVPRAALAVDNIGRELTEPINTTQGAEGATARLMAVMRSRPDVVEWEVTLDLFNARITPARITAQLGWENLFATPAVRLTFRPETAPGLF